MYLISSQLQSLFYFQKRKLIAYSRPATCQGSWKKKKRASSARCLMNLLFPQKRSKYLSAVWAIMRSNSAKHVPVGHSKQRNKGQDIVSVNEANFKGSSEAFSECFTEPRCFSNHRKSSLTKGGKTVKNTLKSCHTKGLLKSLNLEPNSSLIVYINDCHESTRG